MLGVCQPWAGAFLALWLSFHRGAPPGSPSGKLGSHTYTSRASLGDSLG